MNIAIEPKDSHSVIIIDDNAKFCSIISDRIMLEDRYHIVGIAENGIKGMDKIHHYRPDIIVLDIMMPFVDGITVLEELRDTVDYDPIIIVYSAINDEDITRRVFALGAKRYFVKPFDADTFMKRLNELVGVEGSSNKPQPYKSPNRILYYQEATNILKKMGMPPHVNGYQYLREAVILVVEDFRRINTIMSDVYGPVAQNFSSTIPRVERAMRHAIEVTWNRCRVDVIEEIFGNTVDLKKDKPSNSEFIARVADRIKLIHKIM